MTGSPHETVPVSGLLHIHVLLPPPPYMSPQAALPSSIIYTKILIFKLVYGRPDIKQ